MLVCAGTSTTYPISFAEASWAGFRFVRDNPPVSGNTASAAHAQLRLGPHYTTANPAAPKFPLFEAAKPHCAPCTLNVIQCTAWAIASASVISCTLLCVLVAALQASWWPGALSDPSGLQARPCGSGEAQVNHSMEGGHDSHSAGGAGTKRHTASGASVLNTTQCITACP